VQSVGNNCILTVKALCRAFLHSEAMLDRPEAGANPRQVVRYYKKNRFIFNGNR
jgi:hypothetical protein